MKKKKGAIIYDWIDSWGGAERLLLQLHDIFPEAIWFTSSVSKRAKWAQTFQLQSTFLQRFPSWIRDNRLKSFVFYPLAFESMDLTSFDWVLSVSSLCSKAVITHPHTYHLCYLLTPPRYIWGETDQYFPRKSMRFIGSCLKNAFQKWDFTVAQRPDDYLSISQEVAHRCFQTYGRASDVLYPSFDTKKWNETEQRSKKEGCVRRNIIELVQSIKPTHRHLLVSRLEPYKKIEIAIQGIKEPDHIIIVGEGSQQKSLAKIAQTSTHFLGKVTDEELVYLYTHATSFIMPQREEFGYTACESLFFGCPIISYSYGGVSEIISNNVNAVTFDNQSVESFQRALARFHTISYNLQMSAQQMRKEIDKKFSKQAFESILKKKIENGILSIQKK